MLKMLTLAVFRGFRRAGAGGRGAVMVGPVSFDFACTLGLPCAVDLEGFALAEANRIALLSSGTCGAGSPVDFLGAATSFSAETFARGGLSATCPRAHGTLSEKEIHTDAPLHS